MEFLISPLHLWYVKIFVFKYYFKVVNYLGGDGINPAKVIALTKLATTFSFITFLKYDKLLLAIIGMSWKAHSFSLTCALLSESVK